MNLLVQRVPKGVLATPSDDEESLCLGTRLVQRHPTRDTWQSRQQGRRRTRARKWKCPGYIGRHPVSQQEDDKAKKSLASQATVRRISPDCDDMRQSRKAATSPNAQESSWQEIFPSYKKRPFNKIDKESPTDLLENAPGSPWRASPTKPSPLEKGSGLLVEFDTQSRSTSPISPSLGFRDVEGFDSSGFVRLFEGDPSYNVAAGPNQEHPAGVPLSPFSFTARTEESNNCDNALDMESTNGGVKYYKDHGVATSMGPLQSHKSDEPEAT